MKRFGAFAPLSFEAVLSCSKLKAMRHSTFVLMMMASGILASCKGEKPISAEDCFSSEIYRLKLGNAIFDVPAKRADGLALWFGVSSNGKGIARDERATSVFNHPNSFVTVTSKDENSPFFGTMDCQRKESVPFDVGMWIGFSYFASTLRRSDSFESFSIALPEALRPEQLRSNLFKVSEIPSIQVVSDITNPTKPSDLFPHSSLLVFAVGQRRQQIYCNVVGCQPMAIQDDDGLVFLVEPKRYTRNYANKGKAASPDDTFDFTPVEDLPESVFPVLNYVRGFRNKTPKEKDHELHPSATGRD